LVGECNVTKKKSKISARRARLEDTDSDLEAILSTRIYKMTI